LPLPVLPSFVVDGPPSGALEVVPGSSPVHAAIAAIVASVNVEARAM
jgi:hypothetical protein